MNNFVIYIKPILMGIIAYAMAQIPELQEPRLVELNYEIMQQQLLQHKMTIALIACCIVYYIALVIRILLKKRDRPNAPNHGIDL